MRYKKALPDIDSSFAKYVAGKAVGIIKPVAEGFLEGIVGVIAVALACFALWIVIRVPYYFGWYVGGKLGLFNVAKIHDDNYLWTIGPAPWIFAILVFVVPLIIYKIGSAITTHIKRKLHV